MTRTAMLCAQASWCRLVRHWVSLRFDDTLAVKPSSLEVRGKGLSGVPERTKTSGPGRKLLVLPFVISFGAWIKEKERLRFGFKLLQDDLLFSRDYLLPLLDALLEGSLKRRALPLRRALLLGGAA